MLRTPRRVLITGASGFVGGHLTRALAQAFPDAALLPARFDLLDATAIDAAVRESKPDVVVHLAAISAIPSAQQDPDRAWRVNLDGTLRLARAIMRYRIGGVVTNMNHRPPVRTPVGQQPRSISCASRHSPACSEGRPRRLT